MSIEVGLLAAALFWGGLFLSTGLALAGVWRRSARLLIISALLSAPFALLMAAYPPVALKTFLALPFLHLLTALTLHRVNRRLAWLGLVLIVGLGGWFLVLRFASAA